jgi:hypothetical protein
LSLLFLSQGLHLTHLYYLFPVKPSCYAELNFLMPICTVTSLQQVKTGQSITGRKI